MGKDKKLEKKKNFKIAIMLLLILLITLSLYFILSGKNRATSENQNSRLRAKIEKESSGGILKIAELVLNPQNYTGKEVKVRAKIEDAVVIGDRAYVTLFDGTARVVAEFNASKENILRKKWLFLVDADMRGMHIEVRGILRRNVPILAHESSSEEAQHGIFPYLIEIEDMKEIKESEE